jgi:hypothetical protein
MAEDTDLATGIAQNIGYMPMVNAAGQAGSGFMDFLGSLLGGRSSAPAAPAQARTPSAPGFFGGLWDALQSGARSSADAFQSDVQDIQNRTLPREAMRAAGEGMAAYGNPAVNPAVPALRYAQKIFDPNVGWIDAGGKIVPGGDWLSLFSRQGNLGPLIEALVKFAEKNQFQ